MERLRSKGTLSGHNVECPAEIFLPWCPRIAGCLSGNTLSFDPRMGRSTAGQGHEVLSCLIKLTVVFQPLLPGVQNSYSSPFSWGQFGCRRWPWPLRVILRLRTVISFTVIDAWSHDRFWSFLCLGWPTVIHLAVLAERISWLSRSRRQRDALPGSNIQCPLGSRGGWCVCMSVCLSMPQIIAS